MLRLKYHHAMSPISIVALFRIFLDCASCFLCFSSAICGIYSKSEKSIVLRFTILPVVLSSMLRRIGIADFPTTRLCSPKAKCCGNDSVQSCTCYKVAWISVAEDLTLPGGLGRNYTADTEKISHFSALRQSSEVVIGSSICSFNAGPEQLTFLTLFSASVRTRALSSYRLLSVRSTKNVWYSLHFILSTKQHCYSKFWMTTSPT